MNKKVIYTCIIGDYDDLNEPKVITDGFDYVCFTDQPFKSKVWEIRPIPDGLNGLSQVKKQRRIKIKPHEYLPEYDFSVWVDGNIKILENLNGYIEEHIAKARKSIFIPKHPQRDCIYEEAEACIKLKKDTSENIYKQIDKYKDDGFPEKYGLAQTNIMFRRHNSTVCKKIMDLWWQELENGSHRDQLSLFYILWKCNGLKNLKLLDETLCKSQWFSIEYKHKHDRKNARKNKPDSRNFVSDTKKKDDKKKSVTHKSVDRGKRIKEIRNALKAKYIHHE